MKSASGFTCFANAVQDHGAPQQGVAVEEVIQEGNSLDVSVAARDLRSGVFLVDLSLQFAPPGMHRHFHCVRELWHSSSVHSVLQVSWLCASQTTWSSRWIEYSKMR